MQLAATFHLLRYRDADHGSIVLISDGYRRIAYGIKAFSQDKADRHEYLVDLGSPGHDEKDIPALEDASGLENESVIDISEYCRFSPSLNPADMMPAFPTGQQSCGVAFILENQILLGLTHRYRSSFRRITYVNVETGELLSEPDHSHLFATRRWYLVDPTDDEQSKILFKFEANSSPERT